MPVNHTLSELITALEIIKKYGDPEYPTHCEHDELFVKADVDKFSREDVIQLEELGFLAVKEGNGFHSFRFGSC